MTQRILNLWGGALGAKETLELHQSIEDNFTELFRLVEAQNFADALTAARGGVEWKSFYHTDGTLKIQYQQIAIPAVAALGLTGYVPRAVMNHLRNPAVVALTLTGGTPSVQSGPLRVPATAVLALTGRVPSVVVA